jgi:hypothetical protein
MGQSGQGHPGLENNLRTTLDSFWRTARMRDPGRRLVAKLGVTPGMLFDNLVVISKKLFSQHVTVQKCMAAATAANGLIAVGG